MSGGAARSRRGSRWEEAQQQGRTGRKPAAGRRLGVGRGRTLGREMQSLAEGSSPLERGGGTHPELSSLLALQLQSVLHTDTLTTLTNTPTDTVSLTRYCRPDLAAQKPTHGYTRTHLRRTHVSPSHTDTTREPSVYPRTQTGMACSLPRCVQKRAQGRTHRPSGMCGHSGPRAQVPTETRTDAEVGGSGVLTCAAAPGQVTLHTHFPVNAETSAPTQRDTWSQAWVPHTHTLQSLRGHSGDCVPGMDAGIRGRGVENGHPEFQR